MASLKRVPLIKKTTRGSANKVTTQLTGGAAITSSYFTPGQPQRPQGPADLRGRALDYPVGVNITTQRQDQGAISHEELRALAEHHDITRLLIETRKDQMEALQWTVRPVDADKNNKKEPSPDLQARIDKTVEFMRKPDGKTPFGTWLRKLLEDLLVIDQPVIYVNRKRPGNTRMEVLDGATIKRIVDIYGRSPEPPEPAYQQVIKGLQSWNYAEDELVFLPRNPRPQFIYGMSPVQQIVITVNIALRRQLSQLQYYTEGNIPDALISVPEDWSPEQIIAYQKAWDALHEGNTAQRRKAKFVPSTANIMETRKVDLKDEFDEWLARVACYAFSISPQAFTKMMNRSTAETAHEAAQAEGLAPLMRWAGQLCNIIIQEQLGQTDLEFVYIDDEEQDPDEKIAQIDLQLRNGTLTINEARSLMGRDPIDGGNVAMIYTASGPLPVHIAAQGPQQPLALGGPGDDEGGDDDPKDDGPPNDKTPPEKGGDENGKKDEEKPDNKGKQAGDEKDRKDAARKAAKNLKTLYIRRNVTNAQAIIDWAKAQGFEHTITAEDMHVTVCYSKAAVDWDMAGAAPPKLVVKSGPREVHTLGDKGAVVLGIRSFKLQSRHQQLKDIGCSHDFPKYLTHVTLTYKGSDIDLDNVEPYYGPIEFGPEIFDEVNDKWSDNIKEAAVKTPRPFVAKAKKKWRTLDAIPSQTHMMTRQELAMSEAIKKVFAKMAPDVAEQVAKALRKFGKADDDDKDNDELSRKIVTGIDLSTMATLPDEVVNMMLKTAKEAGTMAIGTIGVDANSDLVDQVNDKVMDWATNRSAELVGMRYTKDGDLIENPNAKWAIDQPTRDMLRSTIRDGLDAGMSVDQLQQFIMNGGIEGEEGEPFQSVNGTAFSEYRARMIARTEVLNAHNSGAMVSYREMRDNAEIEIKKEWLLGPDPCDDCIENADAGAIDLDDDFPSGDDAPPAHPHCVCAVAPVVPDMDHDKPDDEDQPDNEEE